MTYSFIFSHWAITPIVIILEQIIVTASFIFHFHPHPPRDLLCSAGVEQAAGGSEVDVKSKFDLNSLIT